MEPVPPAVEAQSLNHWTVRKVPGHGDLMGDLIRFLFNRITGCCVEKETRKWVGDTCNDTVKG